MTKNIKTNRINANMRMRANKTINKNNNIAIYEFITNHRNRTLC